MFLNSRKCLILVHQEILNVPFSWKERFCMCSLALHRIGQWISVVQPVLCPAVCEGCGMGPWLVLISPCFRENVVGTCKIGSFSCSLDNLLQKNVIVSFFGNQISKWPSFEKRAIFDLLFTFLVTREELQKFLKHISHSHTYTYFGHPIDVFCLTNFEKKIRIDQIWFLFGMSSGVDSYSRNQ